MSTYIHSYDDEDHDRFFEVRIEYDFEPGYRGSDERGSYWVPGQIEIRDVFVLHVEYYNPDGEVIAKVERHNMGIEPRVVLDGEAFQYIEAEIEEWDILAEELAENAG
jgi:hypothetical protein